MCSDENMGAISTDSAALRSSVSSTTSYKAITKSINQLMSIKEGKNRLNRRYKYSLLNKLKNKLLIQHFNEN